MMSPTLSCPVADRNGQHAGLGAGHRLGADLGQQRDQRQQLGPGTGSTHRTAPGCAWRSGRPRRAPDPTTGRPSGARRDPGPPARRRPGSAGPATSAAVWTVCRVAASSRGSMSVEFSGHRMKSGCGDLPEPGLDRQVDGLGEVVVGHRAGPPQRLDPPPGHVALHDADVTPAAGRRRSGSELDEAEARPDAGPAPQPTRDRESARRRPSGSRRAQPEHDRVRDELARAARPGTRRRRRR